MAYGTTNTDQVTVQVILELRLATVWSYLQSEVLRRFVIQNSGGTEIGNFCRAWVYFNAGTVVCDNRVI
jgi:hypothetical protein